MRWREEGGQGGGHRLQGEEAGGEAQVAGRVDEAGGGVRERALGFQTVIGKPLMTAGSIVGGCRQAGRLQEQLDTVLR